MKLQNLLFDQWGLPIPVLKLNAAGIGRITKACSAFCLQIAVSAIHTEGVVRIYVIRIASALLSLLQVYYRC
jgi:hypothetical protein